VEGEYSEVGLPLYGVLGTSALSGSLKSRCGILHSPAPGGVG
jgi:hypothetical protein